jgi:hypothetical protein
MYNNNVLGRILSLTEGGFGQKIEIRDLIGNSYSIWLSLNRKFGPKLEEGMVIRLKYIVTKEETNKNFTV